MNVSLTEELRELVEGKVSTGYYKSASEVIREGLRLLAERDDIVALKHQAIRAKIAEGIDQADAGNLVDGEEAVARARSKIDEQKNQKSGN